MERRRGQDQHRHGLVGKRSGTRHSSVATPTATCSTAAVISTTAPRCAGPFTHRASDAERVQERADKDRVTKQAMIELYHQNILEETAPQRRLEEQSGINAPAFSGQVLYA
jgi:hypothetical protein